MDVRCERCQARYVVDDGLVDEAGLAVRCSKCGHLFRAMRPPRGWKLRRSGVGELPVGDTATLQKWIVEGKALQQDEVARDGGPWLRAGELKDLQPFFAVVDRARRAPARAGDRDSPGRADDEPTLDIAEPTSDLWEGPRAGTAETAEPAWAAGAATAAPADAQARGRRRRPERGSRLPWVLVAVAVLVAGGTAVYLENPGWLGLEHSPSSSGAPPAPGGQVPAPPAPAVPPPPAPAPVVAPEPTPAPAPAVAPEPTPAPPTTPGPEPAPPSSTAVPPPPPPTETAPAPAPTETGVAQPAPPPAPERAPAPTTAPIQPPKPPPPEAVPSQRVAAEPAAPAPSAGARPAAASAAPGARREATPARTVRGLLAEGRRLRDRGKSEAALDVYAHAVQLEPTNPDALAGRGLCYLDLSQYVPAEESFKAALAASAENSAALMGLAETYRYEGRRAEAVTYYRRYLAVHPTGEDAAAARNAIGALEESP